MPQSRLAVCAITVALALLIPSPTVVAQQPQLQLVASGLSSPLFLGHAGDGSGRLFIVERAGMIRVLQAGGGPTSSTVFLDIRSRVLSGGERGLLGLAFHPFYDSNGRFFVFYTRLGDGALVIAEYGVSADPDVASSTETILLTIPHPGQANHNGGMLAFGPDGYLYIGVGDGGSGDDPPNNAQNLQVLLGKILRIDIDAPGVPYAPPPTNPFVGNANAEPEIFAYGLRNPWRFAFDRGLGDLWVADVGQGSLEEVDTPIVSGGNYGWRVFEGSECSGNDPVTCDDAGFIPPIFDYAHSGGRCSITGGYVYRGAAGAVPVGTYVFGDFCTGEIFAFNGSLPFTVLFDTTMSISSFGEDESGELYVVNLGGTVSRLVSATPCTYGLSPNSQAFASSGGAGTVSVAAGAGCDWTAGSNASWIDVTSGTPGSGNGTVGYSVDLNSSSTARTGTMTIAGLSFTVTQAAPASCSFSIAPARATFGGAGGSGSVAVTAPAGCAWTASSGASWIAITGGASGTGSGVVTYAVAAHTGRSTRNGKLTIAGQAFTVKQSR